MRSQESNTLERLKLICKAVRHPIDFIKTKTPPETDIHSRVFAVNRRIES